jgi:outer membrane protein assembly factor BamB
MDSQSWLHRIVSAIAITAVLCVAMDGTNLWRALEPPVAGALGKSQLDRSSGGRERVPYAFAQSEQNNLIRNPSVERNLRGWDPFTYGDTLVVEYGRDETVAADGDASLKLSIVDSSRIESPESAYWIYRLQVDASWAGKSLSVSCEAMASNLALSLGLAIEFWRDGSFLANSRDEPLPPAEGWVHHEIDGVMVPSGATEIRIIGLTTVDRAGTTGDAWFDHFVLSESSNGNATPESGSPTPLDLPPFASPVASPIAESSIATPLVVGADTTTATPIMEPTSTPTSPPTETLTQLPTTAPPSTPYPASPISTQSAVTEDSQMFRGDPAHTGQQPGPGILASPDHLWRVRTNGKITSSPAVVDGVLFVGSYDSYVYALDAESGERRWRFKTGGEVASSPAVSAGMVYIGSNDGNLYALDADTGDEVWRAEIGPVVSAPTVADKVVYVGSWDGNLYAFNAATGAEQWRFATGAEVFSSPAVAGGVVYGAGIDGVLHAVDAETGDERWQRKLTSEYSSPAVADGTVYIGGTDGVLFALSAETGQERWKVSTGAQIGSSPAVGDGAIYIGSDDAFLYCVDAATGDVRWSYNSGGEIFSSPAIADGTVYVGNLDGFIFALDQESGQERWKLDVSDPIYSSPAVVGGAVFVGTEGGVYAIGASTGERS